MVLRGRVEKSDEVKTTDYSVIFHLISNMADRGARYKVYEPIHDKNLLTPCCGADMPTCTFSASVANDQALSVARAELAVEQCASPFRYHIDHGTSLAQFGSAWKSLAQGSAWPSVASTSKRLKVEGTCHSPTRCPFAMPFGWEHARRGGACSHLVGDSIWPLQRQRRVP